MIGYTKYLSKIITRQCLLMSLIKKLLKNYTKLWGKVGSLMNKEFDSEPVFSDNDKYLKIKIKSR